MKSYYMPIFEAFVVTLTLALAWWWMDWYSGELPTIRPIEVFEGLTISNIFESRWTDIVFVPIWVFLFGLHASEWPENKKRYHDGFVSSIPIGLIIGTLYGLGQPLMLSISISCILAVAAGVITGFRLVNETSYMSGICFTVGICLTFGVIVSILSGFGNGLIVAFLVWIVTLIPYSVCYLIFALLKYLTSFARQRAT